MTWIKEKIKIPTSIKPTERQKIAEGIIEHIINRSAAGYDKNNKKFPKYSIAYAKKKGVGVKEVDLILSGEMLESLKVLSVKKAGEILIGFDKKDDENNAKAEGNILGSYGGDPNEDKARDFLGIDQDELDLFLEAQQEEVTDEDVQEISRQIIDEIF